MHKHWLTVTNTVTSEFTASSLLSTNLGIPLNSSTTTGVAIRRNEALFCIGYYLPGIIAKSVQSAWLPQIEAANRVFTTTATTSWVSPTHLADNYARAVSNIAYNTVTATKLVNNTRLKDILW